MIDWWQVQETLLPLVLAALLGGLLGLERQVRGHWAGLRTHMMVAMGSAMFVLAGEHAAEIWSADVTRVIQGVATGVGFIGAGTIIKLTDRMEVKGLTTASSIWLASGAGVACGVKLYFLALSGAIIAVIVLAALRPLERPLDKIAERRAEDKD